MNEREPTPLKRALFDRGLTNRKLAEMIGGSEYHVSRYVRGLRPGEEARQKIAKALRMKQAELWP